MIKDDCFPRGMASAHRQSTAPQRLKPTYMGATFAMPSKDLIVPEAQPSRARFRPERASPLIESARCRPVIASLLALLSPQSLPQPPQERHSKSELKTSRCDETAKERVFSRHAVHLRHPEPVVDGKRCG